MSPAKKTKTVTNDSPVSLTVRIDQKLYVRLSTYRAQTRQTAQEILVKALTDLLGKAK